jgi:flavorubredoxin
MKEYVKALKMTDRVYWVGAIDWEIKDFHGYATELGTTYNAYLIIDEKITLIDTVKAQFKDEMMSRISSVINPGKIDYIISNHAEMDHSGSLPETIKTVKPEKVFASPMGVKALNAHFELDFEITPVKTGEELKLGETTLQFLETKMLHWPDSMFSYLKEEKILFSQDAFGMHLATDKLFEDECSPETVHWESSKYFANILTPYSPQILKLIEDLPGLNLDIKYIATDHGPVWREEPMRIVEKFREWSEQKPTLKAVIVYGTMWHSTANMAHSICDGIRDTGVEVEVIPLSAKDRSYVATKVLHAGALVVGSPTLNNNLFPSIADVMTYLKGLRFKNLIGGAFGSYGWGGESVAQVNEYLNAMNVELISDGIKVKYVPKSDDLKKCYEFGTQIGEALKKKVAEA